MTAAAQARPSSGLSLGVKILYGLGEIANSIKVITFALYSLFFATVVLGLPGTWIGAAAFFAMFWDAAIDPYIGHLTDGAHAFRRRSRFMLIGALTMGLGYWAFFSPPRDLSPVNLLAWLMAASLFVRAATSMYSIPYYAMGANLSNDYNERTSITAIRGITGIVGTSLASSLSFVLFFPTKTPGVDSKLQQAGYSSMGLTFGALMSIVALIALAGATSMRNRIAIEPEKAERPRSHFFGNVRESLRNRSFRVLIFSFSLAVAGLAVSSSLLLHYLTYYLNVSGSVALTSAQFALYAGGLFGTVFWLRMSKRFDKHRLYIFSAAFTAVLTLAALPLFGKGHPLGTGDIRPWLIGSGLAGFSSSILWFIPQSMLADVADESELLTGNRREGALFGIFSFGQQIATGLSLVLAGGLLDRFVKLTPGTLQQSDIAVHRIGLVYSVVPAALFALAGISMLRYKLTRSRAASIQDELHRRRVVEASKPGEAAILYANDRKVTQAIGDY